MKIVVNGIYMSYTFISMQRFLDAYSTRFYKWQPVFLYVRMYIYIYIYIYIYKSAVFDDFLIRQ
jgi:hypothetical protein